MPTGKSNVHHPGTHLEDPEGMTANAWELFFVRRNIGSGDARFGS